MLDFQYQPMELSCLPHTKKPKLENTSSPCVLEESTDVDRNIYNGKALINVKHCPVTPERNIVTSSAMRSRSPVLSTGYNGVTRTKSGKYEARFSSCRVGCYVLAVDAALAYDAFLRSTGRKKHFLKINFKAEQDYMDARKNELKARGGGSVDLEKTLGYITSKVIEAKSKAHRT